MGILHNRFFALNLNIYYYLCVTYYIITLPLYPVYVVVQYSSQNDTDVSLDDLLFFDLLNRLYGLCQEKDIHPARLKKNTNYIY